ncbi:hypothetical protein STEG23_016043 [Scotinomys teguina]
MCLLSGFLDPGGWGKAAAVGLYFIFPGICTLSLLFITPFTAEHLHTVDNIPQHHSQQYTFTLWTNIPQHHSQLNTFTLWTISHNTIHSSTPSHCVQISHNTIHSNTPSHCGQYPTTPFTAVHLHTVDNIPQHHSQQYTFTLCTNIPQHHSQKYTFTLWTISHNTIHSSTPSHCGQYLTTPFTTVHLHTVDNIPQHHSQQYTFTLWTISHNTIHSSTPSHCGQYPTTPFTAVHLHTVDNIPQQLSLHSNRNPN